MYLCLLNEAGEILPRRNMHAGREIFLKPAESIREDIVVAVGCMFILIKFFWGIAY